MDCPNVEDFHSNTGIFGFCRWLGVQFLVKRLFQKVRKYAILHW